MAYPLASVMMVTFNHSRYIRKAIESVVNQVTTFPFELIIGEDCSTDGTRDIALEYQRRFPEVVRVISSEKNVGIHKNVLRTQWACRGEFVAYCEGDDFWHSPAKLQKQVDFLKNHADYVLTHTNYDECEVSNGKLRRSLLGQEAPPNDVDGYEQMLLRRRRILTLTVCARRDALDRVIRENLECTDERWPMCDTQRWLELTRIGKTRYWSESMATYNCLPESASNSRNPQKAFRFTEKAGELILHYLQKYTIDQNKTLQVRARVAFELVAAAYRARDREKMRFWLEQLRATGLRVPVEARLYELWCATRGPESAVTPVIQLWMLYRKIISRVVNL
jgi:glycosyltransferase involved in cell wall biosynthesis